MSGPPSAKAKKKKRSEEHHDANSNSTLKRLKLPSTTKPKAPMPFENTLSLPIQEALYKFRETSEQELIRLRKEGLEPSAAINKLVEKMRTTEGDGKCFSRQELELVMEMAGINEEGAMRALILRSELAKLRHDGFNHPEAINELARRMKRLAGSKRRVSLSTVLGAEGADTKHRKKDSIFSSLTPSLSRVSFNPLDPTHPLSDDPLTPHSTTTSLTRKRLQDAIMMDDEGVWGALKKRPRFSFGTSGERESDESSDESGDEVPLDASELYHFDDVGEFSDEGKEGEDGEGMLGMGTSLDDIPLFTTAFSHHDYPSSDEGGAGEGEYDEIDHYHRGAIHLREIKEEVESEEEEGGTWTTTTTTTTSTTTGLLSTTSNSPSPSSLLPSITLPALPSLTTTRTPRASRPPKQRDSPLSPSNIPPSHRTIS